MLDQDSALGCLELILAMMTDAVMVTTPDLDPPGPRVVYVNEAFTRMSGYASAEVVGKVHRLADGAESAHEVLARLRNESEHDQQARGRAVRYRKDGSGYLLEWQTIPLLDGEGAVHHWITICRDMTPSPNVEKDYLASEHSFRLFVENQPDPICRFMPDTTLTFVNRAYATLFHSTPEEMIGKRFMGLVAERDRLGLLSHLRSIAPDHPSGQYEHRHLSRSGGTRWHLWTTLGYFDETGAVLSYQAVGTDITERKQSEQDLRKLSGAVEHNPSAIIITDAKGAIEYVNPAFTVTSGYGFDEVLGKSPGILKSGLTSEAVYHDLWNTITNGRVWHGELCNKRKKGDSPIWSSTCSMSLSRGCSIVCGPINQSMCVVRLT